MTNKEPEKEKEEFPELQLLHSCHRHNRLSHKQTLLRLFVVLAVFIVFTLLSFYLHTKEAQGQIP